MYFPDVNILVHAIRPDESLDAAAVRDWLQLAIDAAEPFGVNESVLSSMMRIVTRAGLFAMTTTPEQCMTFADSLLGAPSVEVVRPGARHWGIFRQLVLDHRLRGNDVPDAYIASLAMEQGATLVTHDRGFARFTGLRVLDPLAG